MDLPGSAVVGKVQRRISQFNRQISNERSVPSSAVKTRKRTPAKFFKSPIRIKLAQENFCSVAKIQLTDSMERRYKINSFWDWVTVGIYLALGLAGLQTDVLSIHTLLRSCALNGIDITCHNHLDAAATLSLILIAVVWVLSFGAGIVKLYNDRLVERKPKQVPMSMWKTIVWAPFALGLSLIRGLTASIWVATGFVLYISKAWMIGPVLEMWLIVGGPMAHLYWDTKQLAATSADHIVLAVTLDEFNPNTAKRGNERASLRDAQVMRRALNAEFRSVGRPEKKPRRRMTSSTNFLSTFLHITPRVDLLFDVAALNKAYTLEFLLRNTPVFVFQLLWSAVSLARSVAETVLQSQGMQIPISTWFWSIVLSATNKDVQVLGDLSIEGSNSTASKGVCSFVGLHNVNSDETVALGDWTTFILPVVSGLLFLFNLGSYLHMHRTGSYASAFENIATSLGNALRTARQVFTNMTTTEPSNTRPSTRRCSHRGINRKSMKVRFGRINAALAAQKKRFARQGNNVSVQAPVHQSSTSSSNNVAATPVATPKFAPTRSVRAVAPDASKAKAYATPPALRQTFSRKARSERELRQLVAQSAAGAAQNISPSSSGNAKESRRPPKRSRIGLDEIQKVCLIKRSRAGTISKKTSTGRRRRTVQHMDNNTLNPTKEIKRKGATRRKRSRFESLSKRVNAAAALADAKSGLGRRKAVKAPCSPDLAVQVAQRAIELRAKRHRISNTPLRAQNLNLRPVALNVEPQPSPEAVL